MARKRVLKRTCSQPRSRWIDPSSSARRAAARQSQREMIDPGLPGSLPAGHLFGCAPTRSSFKRDERSLASLPAGHLFSCADRVRWSRATCDSRATHKDDRLWLIYLQVISSAAHPRAAVSKEMTSPG